MESSLLRPNPATNHTFHCHPRSVLRVTVCTLALGGASPALLGQTPEAHRTGLWRFRFADCRRRTDHATVLPGLRGRRTRGNAAGTRMAPAVVLWMALFVSVPSPRLPRPVNDPS